MESSIYFIILVSLYHLETSVKGDIFPSSKDSANAVAQNDDYVISMVPINDPNGRDCSGNDAIGSECNKSSMELWPISAMSLDGSRNMIMLKFEEPPKTHLRIKNEKGATGGGSNEMGNFMAMGKPDFMRLGKRPFEKLPLVPMREIRGDGMRDSRGDSFMRFGRLPRTSAADFMRFGRDAGNFMRFGRTAAKQQNYQTRSNNNFMRLGRPDNFMRFGRSSPPAQDENFMRFGKSSGDGGESNTQKDRLHVDKAYGYHNNNNKVMSLFNKGTDEDMDTDYLEN